jgi:DNA segregation ATPase FtsK/SpoIIIE, S-DNA-T family
MNTAARTQNIPFLPPAWAATLKRSAFFTAGLTVVAICFGTMLALLSYTPTDPSLNTATGTAPANTLGLPGAVIADAALQIAGLAMLLLVAIVTAWGVRLMRGEFVVAHDCRRRCHAVACCRS